MKFSIIIPVYNGEKYIEQCLLSVINQKYKNIEIIVVDDGSKDNTKKMVKKIESQDNRVKYFYKENGGVSSARNFGITKATGDYISFLDSDDNLNNECFYLLNEALLEGDYDVLIFNYMYVYNDKKEVGIKLIDNSSFINNLFYEDGIMGFVFNKVYKAKLIKNLSFDNNIKIYEDLLFNVQFSKMVKKYKYIEQPLYYYIQNSDSAMHTTFYKDQTRFFAYIKIIDFLIENEYPTSLISKVMYKYIWDLKRTFALFSCINNKELKKYSKEYRKYIIKHNKLTIINFLKIFFMTTCPKLYFRIYEVKK